MRIQAFLPRLVLVPALFLLTLVAPARAGAPAMPPSVNFLAMGDWGDGSLGQKQVAAAMADFAAKQPRTPDAVFLAGDNFYVKLASTADPAWADLFERMYDPAKLPMPFYAALGNHDHERDKAHVEQAYAAEHPDSRWKMPAAYYRVDLPRREHPLVTVLVLDSDKDHVPPEVWLKQKTFIDDELSKPDVAPWKIAVAHHPLFSNGSHGDIGPLQTDWGPIFKAHHLDFYVCGHDHDLQHLEIPGWSTSFVLCGGGGRATGAMRRNNRGPFSRSLIGFASFELTPGDATVRYIGRDGSEVHAFRRTKAGEVTTLSGAGNDAPTSKPLKALEGIGDR